MVQQSKVTRLSDPCLLSGPSNKPVHAISMSTVYCKRAFTYLSQGMNRLRRPEPVCGDFRSRLCSICAVYLMPENTGFMGLNPASSFGHVLMRLQMHEDALQTMTEE